MTNVNTAQSAPTVRRLLDRSQVEQRVADWFVEQRHIEIPSTDTDLLETGVLDSLGFVELLLFVEQDFGVKVELEHLDLHHFRSIERIAGFLLNGAGRPG